MSVRIHLDVLPVFSLDLAFDVIRSLESGDLTDLELVDGIALLNPEQRPRSIVGEVIYPVVTPGYAPFFQKQDEIVVRREDEPLFHNYLVDLPCEHLEHGKHVGVPDVTVRVYALSRVVKIQSAFGVRTRHPFMRYILYRKMSRYGGKQPVPALRRNSSVLVVSWYRHDRVYRFSGQGYRRDAARPGLPHVPVRQSYRVLTPDGLPGRRVWRTRRGVWPANMWWR